MGDANKQLDRDTAKLKGARKGVGGGGWNGGSRIPQQNKQNQLTEQAKSVRISRQNKQNQSEYPNRTSKISQNTPTEQAKSVRIPRQNKQSQSEYPDRRSKIRVKSEQNQVCGFFSLSLSAVKEKWREAEMRLLLPQRKPRLSDA